MMKLTLAFLATWAAAEAAHGRRHQVRDYGYYSPPAGSALTNSTAAPVPSSSTVVDIPTSSVIVPEEESTTADPIGSSSTPLGYPPYGGETGVGTGSSSVASSTGDALTVPSGTGPSGYPTGYPTGTAPVTDKEVYTTTIYSTQVLTLTVSSSVYLSTTVIPVGTSICTEGETVATTTAVSEVYHTITKTIPYTLGVGPSAHVTEQVVVTTSTETIYKTIYLTKPVVEGAQESTSVAAVDTPTGTTTVKSTSTTTLYITVVPSPVTTASPEGTGVPGEGEGEGDEGEGCAPPVYITVTEQETVTVTQGYETPVGETPASTLAPENTPATSYPSYSSYASVSIPYPLSNSTSVYPGSTGFVTYTKTVETTADVGTGVPEPSFSFVFPTASGEEIPSTTASPEEPSSSAAPSSTSSISYGGYGYGRFRLF